jgi:hypothetical protein
VKLFLRHRQGVIVGRVYNEHNRIHTSAISLPHGTESWLSSQIPTLQCHMALLYALHIKPDGWNRTMGKRNWSACTRNGQMGISSAQVIIGTDGTYSSVNSPPCPPKSVHDQTAFFGWALTARTLNSDVFPAF